MQEWIGVLVVVLAGAVPLGIWWGRALARRARRRRLMAQAFPAEWEAILERNLPPYWKLRACEQSQLLGYINVFLADKSFEGCGGLEITDEIRVTVAGEACMLLLGRKRACYPRLSTIVMYPGTYVAGGKGLFGGKADEKSVRLGESWMSGAVVLAWDSVKRGAANFEDGQNVAFHEFAHQLDQEDGIADGAPLLGPGSSYRTWARVCSADYAVLRKQKRRHRRSVLRKYGATNPAEFFAVATETFFEKPRQLKEKHPDLFDELKRHYRVNPLEWA